MKSIWGQSKNSVKNNWGQSENQVSRIGEKRYRLPTGLAKFQEFLPVNGFYSDPNYPLTPIIVFG